MLLPLVFLATLLLNNFLRETYSSRKLELEKSIENLLDKNVDLGDYVGIRFLGISLGNSKINDKNNIDSEITAKNVYVGIMPTYTFLALISESIFFLSLIFELPKVIPRNLRPI